MPCPVSESCDLHQALRGSVIKRVRHPHVLPQCENTDGGGCALYQYVASGQPVPRGLMPDGSTDHSVDEGRPTERRFLVIEDSAVFATLTSSALRTHFTGAVVDCRESFDEAVGDLRSTQYSAIICGYGLGGDRTVHDVRDATQVPIVVLTGRPGVLELPRGSKMVTKGAGPEALVAAIRESLA
jgi:CheY-like chemotaxis protein